MIDRIDLNYIVERLRKNKNVVAVYLFGSQITGRAREDSDADIAVITKKRSLMLM